jgi:two-component system nitrate/nitrite response regulator NarL
VVEPLRVVVADDHPLMLDAVVSVIDRSPDFVVSATATNGGDALRTVLETGPDLVVLDQSMPGPTGVEVATAIVAAGVPTRVVLLSAFVDANTVAKAMQAGVNAYLPKSIPARDLIDGLRAAASGGIVLHPSLAAAVQQLARRGGPSPPTVLSTREAHVLALLAEGMSNKAIARELGLSAQTVKTYVERLYTKLGVANRGAAVRRGFELGLLEA